MATDSEGFEIITRTFRIEWRVYTRTSGTELPGPKVPWRGPFPSERAAKEALANAPENFTNRPGFGWMAQGGYTTASIEEYHKEI